MSEQLEDTDTGMEALLVPRIRQSLHIAHNPQAALFLAERLVSFQPCPSLLSTYWLASCYLHLELWNKAYFILGNELAKWEEREEKGSIVGTQECRFLLALICDRLIQRTQWRRKRNRNAEEREDDDATEDSDEDEAEMDDEWTGCESIMNPYPRTVLLEKQVENACQAILNNAKVAGSAGQEPFAADPMFDPVLVDEVYFLLGQSYRRKRKTKEALAAFKTCLSFNPFYWPAFEGICAIQPSHASGALFKDAKFLPFYTSHRSQASHGSENSLKVHRNQAIGQNTATAPAPKLPAFYKRDAQAGSSSENILDQPKRKSVRINASRKADTATSKSNANLPTKKSVISTASSAPSSRPNSSSSNSSTASRKIKEIKSKSATVPPLLSITPMDSKIDLLDNFNTISSEKESTLVADASRRISIFYQKFGHAFAAAAVHKMDVVQRELASLDRCHQTSPRIVVLLACSFFEQGRYSRCVDYFNTALSIDPYLVEGMDFYGSALWHLQKLTTLVTLSRDMIRYARNQPQTWAVVGNMYSLKGEHDTAIKCFRRSVNLCPSYPYGHTLCGHEYILNEDLDHACSSFRKAIRIDSRHYQAWYGLGSIYFKQENYPSALQHFQRAISLHPTSPILHCYLGMVLEKIEQVSQAAACYERAVRFAAGCEDGLYKFRLAQAQASQGLNQEALNVLATLREQDPNIRLLQGRILKRMGRSSEAVVQLSKAIEWEGSISSMTAPSGDAAQVKTAMERVFLADVEDDL